MIWHIASVPFWLLGAFWIAAAGCALPCAEPTETRNDIGWQIIVSLLIAGASFYIAARIAS